MGMYIYVTEEQTQEMKKVNDSYLNELLQEALLHDNTILLEENYYYVKSKWWLFNRKRKKKFRYTIYHESRASDGSAYQAQYMLCAGNEKRMVFAYLFGIINGAIHSNEQQRACFKPCDK